MDNINTVWISTVPRTGSMWMLNVTKEIFKIKGFDLQPHTVPQSDTEVFQIYQNKALKETNSKVKFVLKVHRIIKPNLQKSKVITIVRDPRDICISYKDFMKTNFEKSLNEAKSLIKFSKIFKDYDKNYLLTLKYEDILKNPKNIISKISSFLNINISDFQSLEISKKFSKKEVTSIINKIDKSVKKKLSNKLQIDKKDFIKISDENIRAYDKSTGFQTGHISNRNSGDWKLAFSDDEKKILNDEFGNWLKDNGYLI